MTAYVCMAVRVCVTAYVCMTVCGCVCDGLCVMVNVGDGISCVCDLYVCVCLYYCV